MQSEVFPDGSTPFCQSGSGQARLLGQFEQVRFVCVEKRSKFIGIEKKGMVGLFFQSDNLHGLHAGKGHDSKIVLLQVAEKLSVGPSLMETLPEFLKNRTRQLPSLVFFFKTFQIENHPSHHGPKGPVLGQFVEAHNFRKTRASHLSTSFVLNVCRIGEADMMSPMVADLFPQRA